MEVEVKVKGDFISVGELINEKKNNFINFLIEKLIKNEKISEQSKDKINNYIDLIQKAEVSKFIFYIQENILKYKNKTELYVNTLLFELNINNEDINKIDLDKFKRYFDLFITLVE